MTDAPEMSDGFFEGLKDLEWRFPGELERALKAELPNALTEAVGSLCGSPPGAEELAKYGARLALGYLRKGGWLVEAGRLQEAGYEQLGRALMELAEEAKSADLGTGEAER